MAGLLEKIPYAVLIPITVFMLLAPFKPMPHVLEKLIMLKEGTLPVPWTSLTCAIICPHWCF